MSAAKTYRLPEALGGGERKAHHYRDDPSSAGFYLEGEVVWVPLTLLTEAKPPLPEEPPVNTVVLDREGDAWQSDGDLWHCAMAAIERPWAELIERFGPVTAVVPDPFAEPVELPWKRRGVEVQQTQSDGAPGSRVHVSTKDASYGFAHLEPVDARDMARALWAGADKAEKAVTGDVG